MTNKTFTIYKSKYGEWHWEHSLNGTDKVRRQAIAGSLAECIKRFENKGYLFIDRYGYSRESLINETTPSIVHLSGFLYQKTLNTGQIVQGSLSYLESLK